MPMVKKKSSSKKGNDMVSKKTKEIELDKLTYAQLEEEAKNVLSSLSSEDISLDEASKIYEYGKLVSKEMEKRLAQLENSITDTINNN